MKVEWRECGAAKFSEYTFSSCRDRAELSVVSPSSDRERRASSSKLFGSERDVDFDTSSRAWPLSNCVHTCKYAHY